MEWGPKGYSKGLWENVYVVSSYSQFGDSQTVVDMEPLGERVKNEDSQKF